MIPRQLLIVTRHAAGSYVNGEWSEGGTITFTIYASVQPLNARELQSLPEGRRISGESYKLYADLLPILNTATGTVSPDIVTIQGDQFEVFSIEHWENELIDHRKYIVIRKTMK